MINFQGKLFPQVIILILFITDAGQFIFAQTDSQSLLNEHRPFIRQVLTDTASFYYLTNTGSTNSSSDAIGVFDSGIGGLTVLETIINADYYNENCVKQRDGINDFKNEQFIYFGDQANMPYSNYAEVGKENLLQEHILKDALFLLNNKYHIVDKTTQISMDKPTVKAIVIACNTATAFGMDKVEALLNENNIPVKIVGIIEAGAKGALECFSPGEDGVIGIFATPGTVKSMAYIKSIKELIAGKGYSGDIRIVQQGGKGLHESIDNKEEFINRDLKYPRSSYHGPSIQNTSFPIDTSLLDIYHFDRNECGLLCNSKVLENADTIQLNSLNNYVKYHMVSLFENIKKANINKPLKSIILGCTHYPLVKENIKTVLIELKKSGRYNSILQQEVELVDPAVNVSLELFQFLTEHNLLNKNKIDNKPKCRFYLSIPNFNDTSIEVSSITHFDYEYQYYRRNVNELKDYTLIVPFSEKYMSNEQLELIRKNLPSSYKLIKSYH